MGRAKQVLSGPIELTGVGGKKSICDDGMYSVRLPLHNGRDAVLCGLCMPKITTEFPLYNRTEYIRVCLSEHRGHKGSGRRTT